MKIVTVTVRDRVNMPGTGTPTQYFREGALGVSVSFADQGVIVSRADVPVSQLVPWSNIVAVEFEGSMRVRER